MCLAAKWLVEVADGVLWKWRGENEIPVSVRKGNFVCGDGAEHLVCGAEAFYFLEKCRSLAFFSLAYR